MVGRSATSTRTHDCSVEERLEDGSRQVKDRGLAVQRYKYCRAGGGCGQVHSHSKPLWEEQELRNVARVSWGILLVGSFKSGTTTVGAEGCR
jgi:hypothetical protein